MVMKDGTSHGLMIIRFIEMLTQGKDRVEGSSLRCFHKYSLPIQLASEPGSPNHETLAGGC